jgi:hypothetical protein
VPGRFFIRRNPEKETRMVKESSLPNSTEKKSSRRLTEDRIKRAQGAYTVHALTPYAGTTLEDLLDPLYWKLTARRFVPGDELRVVPEDGAWYAHLFVTFASISEVFVQELFYKKLVNVDESQIDTGEYEAKWIAPPVRFGVRRKSDQEVIKSGFATLDKAVEWMHQNVRPARKAA